MIKSRFEIGLAAAFLVLFLGFFLWQSASPWRSPLTPEELDQLVAALEDNIVQAPEEKAAFIARMRESGSEVNA